MEFSRVFVFTIQIITGRSLIIDITKTFDLCNSKKEVFLRQYFPLRVQWNWGMHNGENWGFIGIGGKQVNQANKSS